MHLTIRWKFILSIAITLLITYLVLVPWDYRWQRETATLQIQDLANERAHGLAGSLNERFAAGERQAEAVVSRIVAAAPTTQAQLVESVRDLNGNLPIILAMEPTFDGVDKSVPPAERHQPALYQFRGSGRERSGRGRFAPDDSSEPPDPAPPGGGGPMGMMAPPGGAGAPPIFGGRAGRGGGRAGRGQDPGALDGQFRGGRLGQRGRRGNFGPAEGLTPIPPNQAQIASAYAAIYSQMIDTLQPVWFGPQRALGQGGGAGIVCIYATPIVINDKFRGVASAVVPVEYELQEFRLQPEERARFAATAPTTAASTSADIVLLIDEDGALRWPDPTRRNGLVSTRDSLIDRAEAAGMTDLVAAMKLALTGENQIVRLTSAAKTFPIFSGDQSYWISLSPITSNGWIVAAAIPESQFLNRIHERLWQRVIFLLAALLLLLIITALISIRITRPITRMATAVNQLAAGNLDAQVTDVSSKDELGQLAGAFNTMTRQLKSHVAALTEQTAARESVEAELRIARQIQTDLLPRTFPPFPDRHEFDLHAVNVPAQRVAGDFYDFFFVSDTLLTVTIADVSGKGVPAALLMAVTRTIIRNLASEGLSPVQIAERANAMLLHDISESMFVTMFLMQYETTTGRITYVNAGHPAPYRISADGEAKPFGAETSPILGVNATGADWNFQQHEDRLEIGQTLLLYTDGVTEARSPDGRMLQSAGVERLISKYRHKSVEAICVSFVDELNRYQHGFPADDITLVALKRRK